MADVPVLIGGVFGNGLQDLLDRMGVQGTVGFNMSAEFRRNMLLEQKAPWSHHGRSIETLPPQDNYFGESSFGGSGETSE